MSERMGAVAGTLLCAVAWACSLGAQTPANPISTKPEGSGTTCSYTGSVTDGKATSSSTCPPGATPGTDSNQLAPATQRFPFPGEAPTTPLTPAPQTSTSPTAPTAPAVTPNNAQPGNAAQRFPFPGETAPSDSTGAPAWSTDAGTKPPPLQDAGSSGSSSSSSSSSSSQTPGSSSSKADGDFPDDDPNAPMPTPRHNPRKKLPPVTKPVTPDEQEAEDVQVAGFYQNDGNYKAAYERAKEAVGLDTSDPDAHLALAEAARKLGKLDEAEANYKKTLTLDPVPKTRKVAEKALKEMSGS